MKVESKSRGKVFLVIAAVLIIAICLVVPVWQSAVNSQLGTKISSAQREISSLESQKMAIQADIAHHTTPEYLIEQAVAQNINFNKTSDTTILALAKI